MLDIGRPLAIRRAILQPAEQIAERSRWSAHLQGGWAALAACLASGSSPRHAGRAAAHSARTTGARVRASLITRSSCIPFTYSLLPFSLVLSAVRRFHSFHSDATHSAYFFASPPYSSIPSFSLLISSLWSSFFPFTCSHPLFHKRPKGCTFSIYVLCMFLC